MSAFIRAPFAEIAPHLEATGYQPVPIKPGFKAPLIDGWQVGQLVERYLPQCARWGTGILTAACPAIDLDVKDKEIIRAPDRARRRSDWRLAVPDRQPAQGAHSLLDRGAVREDRGPMVRAAGRAWALAELLAAGAPHPADACS